MANEIINDAVHDIRDLAKQAFNGLELTLQQSRDFDLNINIIKEFSVFVSQNPDALIEHDKRDTIKQLNLVYDELVAYGLQSNNDTTRNLIANATNSMFNLNSALIGSLTQYNSQQQTQAQTQKLNGLEMGVEAVKFGAGVAAATTLYAATAAAGVLAVVGRKGGQWTQDMFNKSFSRNHDMASNVTFDKPLSKPSTGLISSNSGLAEPKMSLSTHLDKQNEINYLGATNQLGNKLALVENLGLSDKNTHERLKERTVESLLSDIDFFDQTANALSPASKEKMRAMNELIASSLDNFDLKPDSFKDKLGESIRLAFEKIKSIIFKTLNLDVDNNKGISSTMN